MNDTSQGAIGPSSRRQDTPALRPPAARDPASPPCRHQDPHSYATGRGVIVRPIIPVHGPVHNSRQVITALLCATHNFLFGATVTEPRLGGLFTERWDNGGQVIASVTGWAQDEHLQLTGSFHMGVGVGVATFDLAEAGAGTLLQFWFRAIGVVDTAVAEDMSRGWTELVGTRLKELAETGTRFGIDPGEPPSIRSIR